LGLWIPRYKICENHCSPFEHLYDRYYDRYTKTIALAARGAGKSYNTGLEVWLKARFKRRWGAIILGGSKVQSERSYKATDDFWKATEDIGGKDDLLDEPTMWLTQLKNGSWYRISTASTRSVHGWHQPALYLDEIDEMDRDVLHGALPQAQTMNGHTATWSFISTRHKAYGLMAEWVDAAEERGFKLYTWCILEAMEACVDYECSTCKLHDYCGGRMKPVLKMAEREQIERQIIDPGDKPLMGFNTVEDTINKVQFASGNVFDPEAEVIDVEAYLFCQKPSRQGLVYKEYDPNVHGVKEIKLLKDPAEAEDMEIGSYVMEHWQRFQTFDFGLDDPMVVLDCFRDPMGRIYVYDEIYERGITELDLAPRLTNGINYTFRVGDISAAAPRKNLGRFGIQVQAFKQGINEGLVLVRNQMKYRSDGTVGFYVNKSRCPYTNWELGSSYRYPKNSKRDVPEDANNHAADSLRYLIFAIRKGRIRQSNYR
jgi:hypothetical protein